MRQTTRAFLLSLLGAAACHTDTKPSVAFVPGDAAQVHDGPDGATRDGSTTAAHDAGTQVGTRDDASTNGAPDQLDAGHVDDAGTVTAPTRDLFVYVGGYGDPYPFHTYVLDRAASALVSRGASVDMGDSPTFIAASADRPFLYLAMESSSGKAGVITAFVDDAGMPMRRALQPSERGLVFTSLDPSGKYVLAASYEGGYVKVYPIQADGTLGTEVDTERFDPPASGASSAQTHSIRVHPNGKWAYVPNKATNEVAQFRFDVATGALTPLSDHRAADCPGGPRHLAFDATGSYVFVATELSSELVSFRAGDDGVLTELDRKSTLASPNPGNTGAHVLVHPNQKFVYTSNRGDDSIAVFAVGSAGTLTLLQNAPTAGKTPRNFDIDSEGAFLVAANQGDAPGTGSLVVFSIGEDGRLTRRGAPLTGLDAPAAVSLVARTR